MPNIYFDLSNCYGISSFKYTFAFNVNTRAYMIYAPNGIMKTSLANTLRDISDGNPSKDCFYPSRITARIVKYNSLSGTDIDPKSILVIESYTEKYKSDNARVLMANERLKIEYESIHEMIRRGADSLVQKVCKISGKRDAGKLITKDYGYTDNKLYECLVKIYNEYSESGIDYSRVKYSSIASADAESILADATVMSQLTRYISQYDSLITASNVFKKVFNHTSAEETLKQLGKGGFFKANHKIVLNGGAEPLDEEKFKKAIEDEKARIINVELADEFKRLDDLLSSKSGTRELRDFIYANKDLIPMLQNIQKFKKDLWASYLLINRAEFDAFVTLYQSQSTKLTEIAEKAREEISEWNITVEKFNGRFTNMPFKLKIDNKEDVVLKSEVPIISFVYESRGERIKVNEDELVKHLSNGEKKALYLLNIIFEVEARRSLGNSVLLVVDDIADSFDYKNKYAIIEYLNDITNYDSFNSIIMTHNFDFYRTVACRLGIKGTSFFANKTNAGVNMVNGQYFENVFYCWKNCVHTNANIFIASIAFIRNIVEYIHGRNNGDYDKLTNMLHYKVTESGRPITRSIEIGEIVDVYVAYWNVDRNLFTMDVSAKYVEYLIISADEISSACSQGVLIEEKIVLSIAIRILSEMYMIRRIDNNARVASISGNQTRALKNMMNLDLSNPEDKIVAQIIDSVLITTSENIHINSFMYEPIVDISLHELTELYNDVKLHLSV